MKRFVPDFKDDTDRIIIVSMFVLTIFFFFIPPLIVALCAKDYISENSRMIAKTLFNFELLLFLISITFLVPLIGWLLGLILGPLLVAFNIIILVLDLIAVAQKSEIKIPAPFEFI